jgi:hypothetical protein
MAAYRRGFIDFYFNFSASASTAGAQVRTGQNANYGWQVENQNSTTDYILANDEVMDIEGVEIIGPNHEGIRDKIKSVRLIIDGKENEMITFNEQNAPAMIPGESNVAYPFRDGNTCINLGRSILAPGGLAGGTNPWSCCPKVGNGEKLAIEVNFPPTTEGGSATITDNMRVRVHYVKIKGENKLLEVLQRNGFLNNSNQVIQQFDIGDVEVSENLPLQSFTKLTPESGAFKLEDWTTLLGGNDVDKPYIENYIQYTQNAAATTVNNWYEFTQDGNRVVNQEQHFKWSPGKFEAYKIEHAGVMSCMNMHEIRFYQAGRAYETVYRVEPDINAFMMPRSIYLADNHRFGPFQLPRPIWGWNETLAIQAKDNGTSIGAWSATNQGMLIGIWGKHFKVKGA